MNGGWKLFESFLPSPHCPLVCDKDLLIIEISSSLQNIYYVNSKAPLRGLVYFARTKFSRGPFFPLLRCSPRLCLKPERFLRLPWFCSIGCARLSTNSAFPSKKRKLYNVISTPRGRATRKSKQQAVAPPKQKVFLILPIRPQGV